VPIRFGMMFEWVKVGMVFGAHGKRYAINKKGIKRIIKKIFKKRIKKLF
jgi:hypothetical protein